MTEEELWKVFGLKKEENDSTQYESSKEKGRLLLQSKTKGPRNRKDTSFWKKLDIRVQVKVLGYTNLNQKHFRPCPTTREKKALI